MKIQSSFVKLSHQMSRSAAEPVSTDRVQAIRTVQYSTVQYSTVQYSTVQYSTVQIEYRL